MHIYNGLRFLGRQWFHGWFIGRDDIGDYMHRWIFECPLGSVRLHHILRDDEARALHDHPWDAMSFILWGCYREHLDGWSRLFRAGDVNFITAERLHRLQLIGGPVWTLCFTGPNRREWGFMIDGTWTHWREAEESWQ